MADVRSLYEFILNEGGGVYTPNALKPSGTSYFPNDGSHGYNAVTGEYEKKRPGVAYASVPAAPRKPQQTAADAATAVAAAAPATTPAASPEMASYAPASAPQALAPPGRQAALQMPGQPTPAAPPTAQQQLMQFRQQYGPKVGMSMSGNIFLNDPNTPTGYRILGRVNQPAAPQQQSAPTTSREAGPALSLSSSV